MKACTGCGVEKPLTEYSRDARSKDGHRTRCKACVATYRQTYAERIAAERVEPAPTDTKTCAECGVEKPYTEYSRNARSKDGYRPNCKVCAAVQQKAYYQANKEWISARDRAYCEANREKVTARKRAWHAEKWATDAEFRARTNAAKTRRYRLLASAKSEPYTRQEIFARDEWTCWLCDEPVDREVEYPHSGYPTIDHVVPISLGGDDTPSNVRLAHLGCNVSRGARVA